MDKKWLFWSSCWCCCCDNGVITVFDIVAVVIDVVVDNNVTVEKNIIDINVFIAINVLLFDETIVFIIIAEKITFVVVFAVFVNYFVILVDVVIATTVNEITVLI